MRLEKHGGHMRKLGIYSKSNGRFCFMCNLFTDSLIHSTDIFTKSTRGQNQKMNKTEPLCPSQSVSWGK